MTVELPDIDLIKRRNANRIFECLTAVGLMRLHENEQSNSCLASSPRVIFNTMSRLILSQIPLNTVIINLVVYKQVQLLRTLYITSNYKGLLMSRYSNS